MPNPTPIITGRDFVDTCNKYNLPITRGTIGSSGENLTLGLLGYFSLFRVLFLDGKEPIVDVLLEIVDEKTPYQAFAQVKSTTQKSDKKGNLSAPIDKDHYNALMDRPLPTYIVAVDLNKGRLSVAPAFSSVSEDVEKIPNTHNFGFDDLDHLADELIKLRNDIITYWKSFNLPTSKSTYKSLL